MWEWLEEIAADKLFYSQRYDGGKTTLRDRGFLMDQYSYKVGSTRLRQVRVKPGKQYYVPKTILCDGLFLFSAVIFVIL